MARRIRKQIYIEPSQEAVIKRLSGETGMAEAEIIRQAIDRHVQSLRIPHQDPHAWRREHDFIVQLMQQGSVAGNRSWRREDLHER